MTITVEATYENGLLRPAEPLPFAEKEKVRVTVHQHTVANRDDELGEQRGQENIATLAEQIAAMARALPPGTLDNLPDDLAAEHDHYLYGTPKRAG